MAGRIYSLVLKVAERCNLKCRYCYMYEHPDQSYRERPLFMDDGIFDAMLNRVKQYCDPHPARRMWLTFHGGEPTLLGPHRLGRLAARAREVLGKQLAGLIMQTNAILLDDGWIDTIRKYDIRVGVSLDGPAEVHDWFRRDHAGRGSHASTIRGLRLLQAAGINVGVLCVVNPYVSGLETYQHIRSLDITQMNFLLPDITHDSKARFYGDLAGTPVADYLIPVFDAWFDEDDPAVKVRLFWDLIRSLLGGEPQGDAFGNPLMGYLVIDTDGTIQALDALKVCRHGISETNLNVLEHGFDDLHLGLPLVHQMVHSGIPLSALCQACPERVPCGGGYLPHRFSEANGFDNPSAWCSDILKLLGHIRARLAHAAAA